MINKTTSTPKTTYGTIISAGRFMVHYNSDRRLRHSFTTRPGMRGHVTAWHKKVPL